MRLFSLLIALPLAGCGAIDLVDGPFGHGNGNDADGLGNGGAGTGAQVRGTGKPVREARAAKAATTVEAGGAIQVVIRKGPPKLVVEAQKEILRQLRTEYRDGRLVMWLEGTMSADLPIRAWYTGPNVSSVEGSGASTFDATGLSGARSAVRLSGASKAKLEGSVGRLDVEASGASEADLKRLSCGDATVEASGASKVWLRTKGDLRASASGASEVRYFGKPAKVKGEANGASSVAPG